MRMVVSVWVTVIIIIWIAYLVQHDVMETFFFRRISFLYKSTLNVTADMGKSDKASYAIPQITSVFVREFFAVSLLLTFEARAEGVDFFNSSVVLFLILVVVRLPYINSYAFLFDVMSAPAWNIKHVGAQHYDSDGPHNGIHALFVLAAHVLGAVAAAAGRVYCTVTFGQETVAANIISPAFTVSTNTLEQFGATFGADQRLAGLNFNGSRIASVPLKPDNQLGISGTALVIWYLCEEIAYVCLLCICFVHIWLGTGVGAAERNTPNPFRPRYWAQLCRLSIMLCLIYAALERAFPTAHGSLHVTIYKCQMQVWNPSDYQIDFTHYEHIMRAIGGLIGMGLARMYNNALVSTRENPENEYYYRLVWGMESPHGDGVGEEDEEAEQQQDDDGNNKTSVICVVRKTKIGGGMQALAPNFRLRLPSALNHLK